jgi:putative transposase
MVHSTDDLRVVPLPGAADVLTEVLRAGAQKLLAQAIEAEVADWIDQHQDCRDTQGHRQVVRNGHLPARTITTGIGPVELRQPRVRDRRPAEEAEKFSSKILPPYLRKTKAVEELIPWLYLKGVSTGDFSEALAALLGPEAPGLSAATITRLKGIWGYCQELWTRIFSGGVLLLNPIHE